MAKGTLHPAKPDRHRRGAPMHSVVELQDDGAVRGPELEDLTRTSDWSDYTLHWYSTWRTAPQAQLFEDTDWQRLGMLAFIVERFQARPAAAALQEIRMNEERLGATVTDRMRGRMSITRDDQSSDQRGQLAAVTNLTDHFADRLGDE